MEEARESYVKTNWDAALDKTARKASIEIIIGSEEGEVLASAYNYKDNILQPALVECIALFRALEICNELEFSQVILE